VIKKLIYLWSYSKFFSVALTFGSLFSVAQNILNQIMKLMTYYITHIFHFSCLDVQ